jgi:hypothetical protein
MNRLTLEKEINQALDIQEDDILMDMDSAGMPACSSTSHYRTRAGSVTAPCALTNAIPAWLLAQKKSMIGWYLIQLDRIDRKVKNIKTLNNPEKNDSFFKVTIDPWLQNRIDDGSFPNSAVAMHNLLTVLQQDALNARSAELQDLQKSVTANSIQQRFKKQCSDFLLSQSNLVGTHGSPALTAQMETIAAGLYFDCQEARYNKVAKSDAVTNLCISQRVPSLTVLSNPRLDAKKEEGFGRKGKCGGENQRKSTRCGIYSKGLIKTGAQTPSHFPDLIFENEKEEVANKRNFTFINSSLDLEVYNLSSVSIPNRIYEILRKGERFITGPKSVSNSDAIDIYHALAKELIGKVDPMGKILEPAMVDTILFVNQFNPLRSSGPSRNGKKTRNPVMDSNILSNWLRDNKIIMKSADKNLGIVLMDLHRYREEVYTLLNNGSTYLKVNPPALDPLETKINILYHITKDLKCIMAKHKVEGHSVLLKAVRSLENMDHTTCFPTFHVMPKLHKTPMKFRPIVPSYACPTTFISKYLDRILQKCLQFYPWVCHGSYHALSVFENLCVNKDLVCMSADVESLYTSIDVPSGLIKLRGSLLGICKIPRTETDLIISLLDWVFNNNFFVFEGNLYRQKHGIAMGTSVAPTFANLVLAHSEYHKMYRKNLMPPGYLRFVDDTWLCIRPSEVDAFKVMFQNLDQFLNWTFVVGDQVPFLDFMISIKERVTTYGRVDLSLYVKDLDKHLYPNPNSDYPFQYRFGWIASEARRVLRNSTSDANFRERISELRSNLIKRQYPANIIDSSLDLRFEDRTVALIKSTKAKRPGSIFISIPHIEGYQEIKKNLLQLFKHLVANYPMLSTHSLQLPILKGSRIVDIGNTSNKLIFQD